MSTSLQLWLDPAEYEALALRLEAERRVAREADQLILAAWAKEDAEELGVAA